MSAYDLLSAWEEFLECHGPAKTRYLVHADKTSHWHYYDPQRGLWRRTRDAREVGNHLLNLMHKVVDSEGRTFWSRISQHQLQSTKSQLRGAAAGGRGARAVPEGGCGEPLRASAREGVHAPPGLLRGWPEFFCLDSQVRSSSQTTRPSTPRKPLTAAWPTPFFRNNSLFSTKMLCLRAATFCSYCAMAASSPCASRCHLLST